MSDMRISAQQALEALKMMRDKYEEYACPACDHADAAIYALRAALVEDAMQKFTDVNQELEAALAEPVQEPEELKDPAEYDDFAAAIRHNERITTWRYDSVGTVALETVYETIIHWDEGGGKRSRRELARRIVDLYTSPPHRKPLTETSAERTLKRLGYTDCGGEFWKPPLGAPAEPVQEPVAHKHEWFSTGAMEPGKMRCIHCGIWNQENAPPQRKPLTREEAIALWADKSDGPSNGEIVSFARAVERAHGITP